MRKKEEYLLNKTDTRELHWIQGSSLKNHIRIEEIGKRANVKPIVAHVAKRRLSLCGHIKRRDIELLCSICIEYITRMVLDKDIETQRQAPRQMDGQYQETFENI